jgi:hypothetical protein
MIDSTSEGWMGTRCTICPNCKKKTLLPFTGIENAVICQNPQCRCIVERDGLIVGQAAIVNNAVVIEDT